VTAVLPCEDGHAQEHSLFGAVLGTVHAGDLWMQERNFCPCALLDEIDRRGALFITRQHAGLPFERVSALRAVGRLETGPVAEQWVQGWMPRRARTCGGVSECNVIRPRATATGCSPS
jgi:hypothetical protein